MLGQRPRMMLTILVSGMLTMLLSAPVTAAGCLLSAPATVAIGVPLTITGSGFPATTIVDLSLAREGGSPDEFHVQSDPRGEFAINLTPEAADVGVTTIVATVDGNCTAEVVIGIGVPAPTEARAPTAAATPRTVARAPTAAAAPRTDAAPMVVAVPPAGQQVLWVVAGLIYLLGIGGLIATRPARSP